MLRKPWVRNLVIVLIVLVGIWLLIAARKVLAPIFLALVIGYVFDPLIDKFEEWKINRTLGIVILCALLILVTAGLIVYIVPKLIVQIQEFSQQLPKYWDALNEKMLPRLTQYAEQHPEEIEEAKAGVIEWLKQNSGTLLSSIAAGLASWFKSISAFVSNILSLVIVPVLAFYFLRDFDLIKQKAVLLVPLKRREFIVGLFTELDQALSSFIKGQMLVALILSVIYAVGLTIAGCPAPLLIALIAGFANLVPYLGIALGLLPSVLLTYLTGNPLWQVILSAVTFLVGQLLEGMVITPKIVGDSMGLHPVVVMIALILGGSYFGFVGMILALPMSAVLMVLLRRLYTYYTGSVLFHEGEPPSPSVLTDSPEPEPDPEKAARAETDGPPDGQDVTPAT